MFEASAVFYLAMFTFGAAITLGAVQLYRVRQSQKRQK